MNINALLKQAKDELGQTVIGCQGALVKAYGEFQELGGQEDYSASLSAIVAGFGTKGVMYSLVREVLHDTEKLNAAVKTLVDANDIAKGDGKRDFLLTTTKKPVDEPTGEPSSSGPDDEDDGETGEVAPVAPKSPVKPTK